MYHIPAVRIDTAASELKDMIYQAAIGRHDSHVINKKRQLSHMQYTLTCLPKNHDNKDRILLEQIWVWQAHGQNTQKANFMPSYSHNDKQRTSVLFVSLGSFPPVRRDRSPLYP